MSKEKSKKDKAFEELKKCKGERYAEAIRKYDNGVLDVPNLVEIVRYAGKEITKPLLRYLSSLKNIRIEGEANEDPLTLLKKAGYDAYYVTTPEQDRLMETYRQQGRGDEYKRLEDEALARQNAIEKYFQPKERLCTFSDPFRYKNYYIINAVREDASQLCREDFLNKEEREDAYGTSVISIQILKKGGFISIKNRYNHVVEHPDNTFKSNPDNIWPGLSASIRKYFDVDFSADQASLPEDYFNIENKIIHFNYEIDNTYFGPDFFVQSGQIFPIDRNKEFMLDNYILNIQDRTLVNPAGSSSSRFIDGDEPSGDAFMDALSAELKNKKISITKRSDGSYGILGDGKLFVAVKDGNLTELHLPTTKELGNLFLSYDKTLEVFDAPLLERVGYGFLFYNQALKKLSLPRLKKMGADFMPKNNSLEYLSLPELDEIGQFFLQSNESLKYLNIGRVKYVGHFFMGSNREMETFIAPCLEGAGDGFFMENLRAKEIHLPSLVSTDDFFFYKNRVMKIAFLPSLKRVGYSFLGTNKEMLALDARNLEEVGLDFLKNNVQYKTNASALVGQIPPERICLIPKEFEEVSCSKEKPVVVSKQQPIACLKALENSKEKIK